MGYLAGFVGAFVGMFLLTRLVRWIMSKFKVQDPTLSIGSLVLVLILAVVIGAFGHADGGPLNWGRSLQQVITLHLPAGVIIVAMDLLGRKDKT